MLVKEDIDYDGDPFLRIDVVFEMDDGDLAPEQMVGLGRLLNKPFEELEETRFPLFSFFKPEDLNDATA